MVWRGRKIKEVLKTLERTKVVQGIIKKHEIENKEISGPNEINNEINRFFKNLIAKTL